MYRVLEKDPTQDDIRGLLRDFKAHLDARGLEVAGVTTDGSNRYPVPLAEVFPDVPHQVCRFHVLKEITRAVLHALAELRKELRPNYPSGRVADPRRPTPSRRGEPSGRSSGSATCSSTGICSSGGN
jgi:hypothetical protein